MKETIKGLEAETENLKANNKSVLEEKKSLQEKLDKFLNEKNEMGLELAKSNELHQRIIALQAELNASSVENGRIKDDLSKWKIATTKIESEWSKKCLETEQYLSNEFNKKKMEFENNIAQLSSKIKASEAEHELRISSLTKDLERIRNKNFEYEEKIRSFVTESEQTSGCIRKFEEKVALLSCEIQRLKHQNSEYEGRSGLISDEVGRLNKILAEYEERIALLSCELERHTFQNNEYREKNGSINTEIDRLKGLVIKFEDKVALLSCEIERLNNKESDFIADINNLRKFLEEKDANYNNLIKEKESNDNFQRQRIVSLTSELDKLNYSLQSKSKEEELLKLELNEKNTISGEKEYWKEQYVNSERKLNSLIEKADEERKKHDIESNQLRNEREEGKARLLALELRIGEILRERDVDRKAIVLAEERFKDTHDKLEALKDWSEERMRG